VVAPLKFRKLFVSIRVDSRAFAVQISSVSLLTPMPTSATIADAPLQFFPFKIHHSKLHIAALPLRYGP
jgi:hypothetical protein